MGRRSRNKKTRNQVTSDSRLSDYQREGGRLLPPLRQLSQLQPSSSSWISDRLPDLIWAALLVTQFPRETVIELFRSVADGIRREGEGAPYDLRLTGLAAALPASGEIINFVCSPSVAKEALSPLLLFPDLPGRQAWSEAIARNPDDDAWQTLASAVATVLNHQSQAATDIRWATVLCSVAAGRFHFIKGKTDHILKELLFYPHLGNQQTVEPTIRAIEGAWINLSYKDSNSNWALSFWNYCLNNTLCFPLSIKDSSTLPTPGTTTSQMSIVAQALLRHCDDTRHTSGVDPRHDAVFGMALYNLAVLSELMPIGANTSISARFSLRTLLEVYVTLAYLLAKDDPELWQSYRVYGMGQAELAYLKLEEVADQPLSISGEKLRELANEDIREELLDTEVLQSGLTIVEYASHSSYLPRLPQEALLCRRLWTSQPL